MCAVVDQQATTLQDEQPPKETFIEVRCEDDVGEIQTMDGPLQLTKSSIHFVRRADVEQLIRQVLHHTLSWSLLLSITHTRSLSLLCLCSLQSI
jgi:hypothetical protein